MNGESGLSHPTGPDRMGTGPGRFIGAGTTRVREHDGITYTVYQQQDGTWKLTNGATGGLSMGIYPTLLKAGAILDHWVQALRQPKRQSGLVSIPPRRHVPGEGVRPAPQRHHEPGSATVTEGPEVEHNGSGKHVCTECGHPGRGQCPGCACVGCDDDVSVRFVDPILVSQWTARFAFRPYPL